MNTISTQSRKLLSPLCDFIATLLVGTGVLRVIFFLQNLPFSAVREIGLLALFSLACLLLFYKWWIIPSAFGVAGLATLLAARLSPLFETEGMEIIYTWLDKPLLFLSFALDYSGGYVPMEDIYLAPISLLMIALVAASCILLCCKNKHPLPPLLVLIPLFAYAWTTDFSSLLSVGLCVCGLSMMLARSAHIHFEKRHHLTSRSAAPDQLFALFLCALSLVVCLLFLPEDTSQARWVFLEEQVSDIVDAWDASQGRTPQRYTFGLRNSGFQPLGDRLGGAVELSDDIVMEVRSPAPLLLRGSVRDVYTGSMWHDAKGYGRYRLGSIFWRGQQAAVFDLNTPSRDDFEDEMELSAFMQSVTLTIIPRQQQTVALFTPGRVVSLKPADSREIIPYFDRQSEVFAKRPILPGARYTVTGLLPSRSSITFRSFMRTIDSLPKENLPALEGNYLQLPEDLPQSVGDLAKEITKDAKTTYDKAVALETYLKKNYTYTLTPNDPPEDEDFVAHFLETGEGYCTYFASAMAVMARTLGLPSRYVEGFKLEEGIKGVYTVRKSNAHAFVEIHFDHAGWVAFDPTASVPREDAQIGIGETMGGPLPTTTPEPFIISDDAPMLPPPTAEPWGLLEFGILAGSILLLLILTLYLLLTRKNRRFSPDGLRRRIPDHSARLDAYYHDILLQLNLIGHPLEIGETPQQFALRIDELLPFGTTLKQVADLVVKSRYGAQEPTSLEVDIAYVYHHQMEAHLRKALGLWKYLTKRAVRG